MQNLGNPAQKANHSDKTAFIFGCGYLGIRVARRLLADGWQVSALTRSSERAKSLAAEGIVPHLGDWTDRRCLSELPQTARVLVAVSHDPRSQLDRYRVYVEGLRNALEVVLPASNLVYVSSTGVYHQSGGIWVDEASPCRPDRDGGAAHLMAEQLLWRVRPSVDESIGVASPIGKTVVLRMAGLYGPGRVPRVASIRRGEPIAADPDAFLNLIHIDDAADCVLAAWEHPAPARCYVIADGTPVLRGDYFAEIARLTSSPPVSYGGDIRDRSGTNKRIWTARMKADLISRLRYPSYRAGLRQILSDLVNQPSTF